MFSKAIKGPPGDGKDREIFSRMSLLSRSHGVSDILDMMCAIAPALSYLKGSVFLPFP